MSYWQLQATLPWAEPLAFATTYAHGDIALLYSSMQETFSGSLSYLFTHSRDTINGKDWATLPLLPNLADGLPLWVGYLGYGMREDGARGNDSPVSLPDFSLTRYGQLFCFDHHRHIITHYLAVDEKLGVTIPPPVGERLQAYPREGAEKCRDEAHTVPPEASPQPSSYGGKSSPVTAFSSDAKQQIPNNTHIISLTSNFTRAAYESVIAETVEHIHAGNFYQANITRKFFGEFATMPDSWQIFMRLSTTSPAPYSAYIRHGEKAILSSSPECFLNIDAQGRMLTRPIKGSARRSADTATDAVIQRELKASQKNHAENLMIVDLMRNDLSCVSVPQSVKVIEQSALYSYRTIHHLISTIESQKLPHISSYEAVRACFPAGSMTGTPKIAAMRWCAAKEKIERGVYSGAIGWFGGGNSCDLSVVIRTLIMDGHHFEFQVGGGIVADSTPSEEWHETMTKARGILAALGLSEEDLAEL